MAAFLIVLLFAQHALATTFRAYDDEGYVLLSLDHYMKGGTLYGEVFSQYGPFYFYAQEALFRLLHAHLVAAIRSLGGCFVYGIFKNIVLASAASLACSKLASVLANEPSHHPQQVILPILLLACCASVPRGRGRFGLLIMGALGAALLFTKINVGGF